MRKYLSIFLAVILMLSVNCVAFASVTSDNVLFDLAGLEIVNPDITDKEVTRGEFAEIVVRLMDMTGLAEMMEPTARFFDVAPDASYAKSVALLSHIGIMNGVGEGKFSPNASVSFEHAVKVMILCTGYENLAKNAGGWPNGYITIASKNGFLKNVNATSPLNREDLYQLLHNTLNIKLLVEAIGSPEIRLEKSGETLRSMLMDSSERTVYEHSGIVTATAYSYTDSPIKNLKDNEVVIDSVIYDVGETNACDLLGHKVEFYSAETEDGFVLLYIRPDSKDSSILLEAQDVISKSGNELEYLDEKNNTEKAELTDYTRVLYNGTRVLYPADDLFVFENGTVELFDHDDDGKIDVVMLWEYVSTIASSFDGKLFNLRNNCFYKGTNALFVDTEDDYTKLNVLDEDGNNIESFTEERVISVFEDLTGSRVKVITSCKTVTGAVSMISDDGITVDGVTYETDSTAELDLRVGQLFTLYLNFEDEVVCAQSKHISNYAYILGINAKRTFSNIEARVLLAGTVDFGVDVNEEDVNDTSQVPFLISQNAGVIKAEFADTVRVDGKNFSGNRLVSALSQIGSHPVGYSMNDAGQINAVETLVQCGGDETIKSKYNVYEMVFGGSELLTGFAITSDTQVICVPNNTSASDEDCMVTLKIDENNNATGYLVSAYEYREDTKTARVLVINADMVAAQVRGVTLTSSKASFINAVTEKYNEEIQDTEKVISILNAGTEEERTPLEVTSENASIGRLKQGDLVSYITNNNGYLENTMIFRSFSVIKNDFRTSNSANDYTETYGTAEELISDEIDTLNYKKVTKMTINVNGTPYIVYVPQRNKPPVYIYNTANDTAEPGELTDIVPGSDKVYVLERSGDSYIRAIVIVR